MVHAVTFFYFGKVYGEHRWTVIQHVPFIRLKLTDVAPFMLLGSDKTTWRIGALVWPKRVCNCHYKTVA
jgi:hypothetical protein